MPSSPIRPSILHVVLVAAAAALLCGVRLDHTPPHFHRDEVMFALQGSSIARSGRDIEGRLFPLYFHMQPLGDAAWFQPMHVYLTALVLEGAPFTRPLIRLPAVIVGTVSVVLMFLLATRVFASERWGLVAAGLLATTPAFVMHSRLAMDFLYPVPFVLGWLWCLQIYIDERRPAMLFTATSLLGVGFYSYIASVMLMPVYLLFTLATLLAVGVRATRPYVIAAAGFAWPLVIALVWLPSHWSVVVGTFGRYHIGTGILRPTAIADRVSTYWRFFDPAFLFLVGGFTRMTNSTRLVGVFLLPFLVLIPLGIYCSLTSRRVPIAILALAGFFVTPAAAAIATPSEPYASDRALAILAFGALLATFGVERLVAVRRGWLRAAAFAVLAILPLHFLFFEAHYFGDYHRRSAYWFDWDHMGGLDEVVAREANSGRPIWLSSASDPMMEIYWRLTLAMHHREDLLPRTVYFDAQQAAAVDLPHGAIILMNRNDVGLDALVESGQLRRVAAIPEPGDPAYYFVLERK